MNNVIPINNKPIPPPSAWDIATYLYKQGEAGLYLSMKELIHSTDKLRAENNNLKAWHQANSNMGMNNMAKIKFQIGEQTMECDWDMSKDPLVILLTAEGNETEAEHHQSTLIASKAVAKKLDSNQ